VSHYFTLRYELLLVSLECKRIIDMVQFMRAASCVALLPEPTSLALLVPVLLMLGAFTFISRRHKRDSLVVGVENARAALGMGGPLTKGNQ
jgi:hypothetical protein